MKSRHQLYLLIPAVTLLAACSTSPEYVMKPDYDYIQKVEDSTKYTTHPARVYWVNPPMKRQQLQDSKQD